MPRSDRALNISGERKKRSDRHEMQAEKNGKMDTGSERTDEEGLDGEKH